MYLHSAVRRPVMALMFVALVAPGSPASAQVYEVLSSFMGVAGGDGIHPSTTLVAGPDGNLYGTTSYDEIAPAIIYRVTLDGVRTVLYRFQDDFGTTYCSPQGKLAVGVDGAL